MSDLTKAEQYVEKAKQIAESDAVSDIATGTNRCDEDTIADTEALVFAVTGKKLHEFEDEEDDALIVLLVEVYDETYIDTYVNEEVAYESAPE